MKDDVITPPRTPLSVHMGRNHSNMENPEDPEKVYKPHDN